MTNTATPMVITTPTNTRARGGRSIISVDHHGRRQRVELPRVLQHRPQRLVDVFVAAAARPTQDAFLHGADLPERRFSATVAEIDARPEPAHPGRPKRERRHEMGGGPERARAARTRPR